MTTYTINTFICPAANVASARATGAAKLDVGLSPSGVAPATHYVSSGAATDTEVAALAPYCSITANDTNPYATIAAAGLKPIP